MTLGIKKDWHCSKSINKLMAGYSNISLALFLYFVTCRKFKSPKEYPKHPQEAYCTPQEKFIIKEI
jgi:hypothetical protein